VSGKPLFGPDRGHIYHKLLDRGFTQRQVVYVLYAASIVGAILGMLMTLGSDLIFHISLVALLGVISIGVAPIGYVEFVEIAHILQRVTEQRGVIRNDVALRKLAVRVGKAQCPGEVGCELCAAFCDTKFDAIELIFTPAFSDTVTCDRMKSLSWGYTIQARSEDPPCLIVEIDLLSEVNGKLGWVRLARRTSRGSMLLAANLLITELQPALLKALEHCMKCPQKITEFASGQRLPRVGAQVIIPTVN